MSRREPLTLYRLWCGQKRYSHWIADIKEIWRVAIAKELAYVDERGEWAGLGPLTWIEKGERKYARSATVSLGKHV